MAGRERGRGEDLLLHSVRSQTCSVLPSGGTRGSVQPGLCPCEPAAPQGRREPCSGPLDSPSARLAPWTAPPLGLSFPQEKMVAGTVSVFPRLFVFSLDLQYEMHFTSRPSVCIVLCLYMRIDIYTSVLILCINLMGPAVPGLNTISRCVPEAVSGSGEHLNPWTRYSGQPSPTWAPPALGGPDGTEAEAGGICPLSPPSLGGTSILSPGLGLGGHFHHGPPGSQAARREPHYIPSWPGSLARGWQPWDSSGSPTSGPVLHSLSASAPLSSHTYRVGQT